MTEPEYRGSPLAVLAFAALTALWWTQTPRVDDPVYEGKRLSEYVAQLSLTRSPGFLSPRSRTLGPPGAEYSRTWLIRKDEREMSELEREAAERRAEDALQALGAQCLPLLIDVIQPMITNAGAHVVNRCDWNAIAPADFLQERNDLVGFLGGNFHIAAEGFSRFGHRWFGRFF